MPGPQGGVAWYIRAISYDRHADMHRLHQTRMDPASFSACVFTLAWALAKVIQVHKAVLIDVQWDLINPQ